MSVSNLYPGGDDPVTVNLGLSLWGMDFVIAENFITLDAAVGGGSSSVKVNGSVITNPNFGSLPAAPVGDTNVIFQVDSSGNVSAYVPIPASAGVVSFNGRTGIVTSVIGDYAAFYDALGAAAAAAAASLPRSLMTTAGDMIYEDNTPTAARLPIGTAGQVLTVVSGLPAWATPAPSGGTVTSFSAGNIDSIVTSSVATATTTPALTFALSTQTANTVWAGPVSGGVATPTFRALVAADIPSLSSTYLPLAGGTMTGVLTLEASTAGLKDAAGSAGSSGNVLTVNGSGYPVWAAPATSGTVTSFSAGNIDAIATSSVATSTTTPALTFSLATQTANTVWAGPASGVAATPTFRALVAADLPAISVSWSSLTNATAALTLNNATFSSTFNQNAGDIWTWGLPSYTAAVSNSPTLELAGSYQSGTGTFAKNSWTIIDTPQAATTNGYDKLVFTHSGTTGLAFVGLPNIQFGATAYVDYNNNGWTQFFSQQNGTVLCGEMAGGNALGFGFTALVQGEPCFLLGNFVGQTGNAAVAFGNNSAFSGASTSSSTAIVGCSIGSLAGINANTGFTYGPTAATGTIITPFIACQITPTINATGGATYTGQYTGLKVAAKETALSSMTGRLIDCYAGSAGTTSEFYVDNKGNVVTVGNLSLNRTNVAGADFAGTATITAASTSVTVSYAANYTGAAAPVVVISPTSDPLAAGIPVGYWVVATGSATAWTGFTINIQTALAGNIVFNYLVIGRA